MRARLVLLGVIVVAGCTRDNPAFETSSGETESLTNEAGSEADGDIDTGQEAPDPVCPLAPGQPLLVKLPPAPTCGGDMPEDYDEWVIVVEGVDQNTVRVGTGCAPGCTPDSCAVATPVPLTIEPLPMDVLTPLDSCLHIRARRLAPLNPESCEFDVVAIEEMVGQSTVPIVLLRNADGVSLPMDNLVNAPQFAAFEPDLIFDDACSCAEFPNECCDALAPTTFVFTSEHLPNTVAPGNSPVTVSLDGLEYEFRPYNAFQPGVCQEPLQVSWALTLKK
jgi:hypothetical protein